MQHLKTGEFFGQTNQTLHLNGLTLTDTEYTLNYVDWHYHENAYFTFILEGNVSEGNKKEVYDCSAGSLIYHNWQEAHYNIKRDNYTRGFQIELKNEWLKELDFSIDQLQGNIKIDNIDLKILFYNIFKETKLNDNSVELSIQTLIIRAISEMNHDSQKKLQQKPVWVSKLKEILYDDFSENLSLIYLSTILNIHPVHLSRDFSKYFNCNLGDYLRKFKIEKSYPLLFEKNNSLTEIAHQCGFSDQSHFCRTFKATNKMSPGTFRKLIS